MKYPFLRYPPNELRMVLSAYLRKRRDIVERIREVKNILRMLKKDGAVVTMVSRVRHKVQLNPMAPEERQRLIDEGLAIARTGFGTKAAAWRRAARKRRAA